MMPWVNPLSVLLVLSVEGEKLSLQMRDLERVAGSMISTMDSDATDSQFKSRCRAKLASRDAVGAYEECTSAISAASADPEIRELRLEAAEIILGTAGEAEKSMTCSELRSKSKYYESIKLDLEEFIRAAKTMPLTYAPPEIENKERQLKKADSDRRLILNYIDLCERATELELSAKSNVPKPLSPAINDGVEEKNEGSRSNGGGEKATAVYYLAAAHALSFISAAYATTSVFVDLKNAEYVVRKDNVVPVVVALGGVSTVSAIVGGIKLGKDAIGDEKKERRAYSWGWGMLACGTLTAGVALGMDLIAIRRWDSGNPGNTRLMVLAEEASKTAAFFLTVTPPLILGGLGVLGSLAKPGKRKMRR